MISVITPVYGSPELASQYAKAVAGTEVIIVDNASPEPAQRVWAAVAHDLAGRYIRNDTNCWYATACNQGYAVSTGDVVMFANNDIMARGEWQERLAAIEPGVLYGPALNMRTLAGQPLIYIDAWWIAARRETWEALRPHAAFFDDEGVTTYTQQGPWDGAAFQGMYWDDVDLCFRAARMGIALRKLDLPLVHLSNYTSQRTEGAYAHTDSHGGDWKHRDLVEARVRAWRENHA
jgi:glycosyltransferase involved in cell wall biosynthesis